MSPRFKRPRKLVNPPVIKGLKPYGPGVPEAVSGPVTLLYEEYEALRLCDYDRYNHIRSSVIMNISRPTFTRIYASARQKIAEALVEGRQIIIEGGKVYFDSTWFECDTCNACFNNPDWETPVTACPLCGSKEIHSFEDEIPETPAVTEADHCICPDCGYETEHQYGNPCNRQICPKCNARMRRKSRPEL